jgi:hypothetical protein
MAPALGALVVLLLPVSYLHALVTRVRTRRQAGERVEIPRRPAAEVRLADLMRERRPVIVEGLAGAAGLDGVADLAALRDLATTRSGRSRVRFHRDDAPYFLYTGDYGRVHDHDEELTLAEFLDMMFGPDDASADDSDDSDAPEVGPPPGLCVYELLGPSGLDGEVGRMLDRMATALDGLADRPAETGASGVWIGSRGVVTPLHHDAWPGLLFQTHGSKRVALFSPTDRTNLYFNAPVQVGSRWSRLPGRSATADPAEFPRADRAIRHEGVLRAGDVLVIPPFWSHEMEALESNISIPFRFRVAPLDRLNPGYLRPAYEVFDGKFVRPVRRRTARHGGRDRRPQRSGAR